MSTQRFVIGGVLAVGIIVSMSAKLSADLIHHYTFDETSGTIASDTGTVPSNGTLTANTGTPITPFSFDENAVAGKVGGALNFERAESDAVALANATFRPGTSDFTIALWVKRSDIAPEGAGNEWIQGLWGQSSTSTNGARSMWARFEIDNSLRFNVDRGTTGTPVNVPNITSTDWMHLAFVRRGDQVEAWVNAVVTIGENPLPTGYDISGDQAAQIGSYVAGNARTFGGIIDDFRYYDTALSATEIAELAGVSLVPGDFNGDGSVDGLDFVAWQTHFPKSSSAVTAEGDGDGDGDVDGADFVIWQTNFPFAPGSATAPVPEPAALTIALLGGIAVGFRRWR